jgi:hypothetical protein
LGQPVLIDDECRKQPRRQAEVITTGGASDDDSHLDLNPKSVNWLAKATTTGV